jgi:hypothetical protein
MSILPLELRNTTDGADALAEIERALRAARKRVARSRTLSVAASSFFIPVAAAALWIIVSRFTLLDLPRWPVLLFIAAWLVAMLVVSSTNQVSAGQCARYLDRTLGLDERVTTLLELARSTPLRNLSAASRPVPRGLLHDTAYQIKAKRANLPGAWAFALQRWQVVAIVAALAVLALGILTPSPLDTVRAEQAALQQRVTTELNQIAQLKAEVVARPGLSDGDRQSLVAELDKLQASLSAPSLDRDGMLAALSDAQQQLQQLSPSTSSDFANILAAARTMQQVMIDAVQRRAGNNIDVTWSPSDFPGLSDLGIAANAADTLGAQANYLGSSLTQNTISLLARASNQAGSDDSDLAGHLLDASTAVSAKDVEKAKAALQQTAQAFRNDDQRWQLAQSVDKIMSNLDDGRQSLAQVGAENSRKQQVGFRRPGAPAQNAAQAPGATPSGNGGAGSQSGQNDQSSNGVTSTPPSALGPQIAGGSADYSSYKGNPPGGAGSGQTGNQGGSQAGGGATQPGTGGGGAAQPGGGGGDAGNGSQGTFTGPISGPVGGGSGAISQVANPAGNGVSNGSASTPADQQSDSIYVPPTDQTGTTDASPASPPGAAVPDQPGAIPGRSTGAGDGPATPSDLGQGTKNQIRTPYKQVIGNYVQQATEALGSVYVPADAKQYVKDYFSELGK